MSKTLQEIEEQEVLGLERENLVRICKEIKFDVIKLDELKKYNTEELVR